MSDSEPQLRTYRGNCHCGAFVYEADLPEIKSATECNCSICHKKGYLYLLPKAGFRIVKGDNDTLAGYTFGAKNWIHKFCPTCATPVLIETSDGARRALNARAIQGVNTWDLEKKRLNGAALGEPYVPPKHEGPLPATFQDGDDQKLYTGSCHCGAVTIALASPPIDETFEGTAECNCSICSRNGYHWAYPATNTVVLHAKDPTNISRYSFGRFVLYKTFCKICGVCLTNEYNYLTDEERKALGAAPADGFGERMKKCHGVNLRVFPEIDLTKLKNFRNNNGARLTPEYVNP